MRQTVVVGSQNDSRGVFVNSVLRAISTKNDANIRNFLRFVRRDGYFADEKTASPKVCWFPGGYSDLNW